MRRRWMIPVALLVCAGCQLLTVAETEPTAELPKVETAELEKLLAAGTWEADRDWSVLKLTLSPRSPGGSTVFEPSRWRFAVKHSQAGGPDAKEPGENLADLQTRYHWLFEDLATLDVSANVDDMASWHNLKKDLKEISQRVGTSDVAAAILLSRLSQNASDWAFVSDEKSLLFGNREVSLADDSRSLAVAIEACCRHLAQVPGDPEDNFSSPGRLLEYESLPEEIRAELFRGIARKIPPRQIPGLNDVMVRHESDRKATPLHLAAMEACAIHAWHRQVEQPDAPFDAELWPDGLAACRFSEDILLRKLYGRWVALSEHPNALAVLKAQRMDNDLGVRESAVLSLGVMKSEAAHHELLAALAKGTDPERVAAIVCLGRNGTDEILRFAQDVSAKVRAAVATELGRAPSKSTALALADLLQDRSPDVQLAALEACRKPSWKAAGQMPLMLHALRVGTLRTRMQALAQLRQEWGQEPMFPLDGTPEERDAAVRELAREHQVSAEVFTAFSQSEEVSDETTASSPVEPEVVRRRVWQFLHAPADQVSEVVADEVWKSLDAAAVPVIEQELMRAAGPRAEQIYREVLPRWHSGYAAVLALEQADVSLRRRAARELHELAERHSLSPCLLRRLSQRITREQDRQVWQDILAAILPDALPESAQIALIALNSSWPDLRLLACEYFTRHPQAEYADWLLPRLQDADYQVRRTTIQILGQCGNPAAIDGYSGEAGALGLRSLLTDPDPQLRWDAVVAMCTLGDTQASQELIRQGYDPRPQQREQAVEAMGRTGQARFVEPLLRQSWTETDRRVQAALLTALDRLVPVSERPGLAPESPIGDKIKEWARWWEQRQQNSAATASSRIPPTNSPRESGP